MAYSANNSRNSAAGRTLGASAALAPHLPFLYADANGLGSDIDAVLDLLAAHATDTFSTALDLGCGKGDVAIAIAKRFGWRVTGIDACKPFIETASVEAERAGVRQLCTFHVGDILRLDDKPAPADVVLCLDLGAIRGDHSSTIRWLSGFVAPEGLLLYADAEILPDRKETADWFLNYPEASEMEAVLESGGMAIAEARRPGALEESERAERLLSSLIKRGVALAQKHPDIRGELERYLDFMAREQARHGRDIVSVTWLLRHPA